MRSFIVIALTFDTDEERWGYIEAFYRMVHRRRVMPEPLPPIWKIVSEV